MRLTLFVCGNYFKKYVQREIAKATGVDNFKPLTGWKHDRKEEWIYTEDKPWTDEAIKYNRKPENYYKKLTELVEPIPDSEWSVFKGDRVQILKGIDTGKQGYVCGLIKERNWCYVEGLNCIYSWTGRTATAPGFIMKQEKPLLVTTEVSLVDPSDLEPTEIEWRYTDEGDRVRVSVRTGRIIPLTTEAMYEGEDFVNTSTYQTQKCDTKEKTVKKVTFTPNLKSFEQDIMDSMGIKETRKKAKNFFY